jgi:autotransporter-associated beta strand protein
LGDGNTGSGLLVMGDINGVSNQTVNNLVTSGTGANNAVQGGASTVSILTANIASGTDTYSGLLGLGNGNFTITPANELGVTKSNNGTLSLTGNNTYLGNTTINRGTVQIFADNNLGNPTGVILLQNTNTTIPAVIEVSGNVTSNGRTITISPSGALASNTSILVDTNQTWAINGGTFNTTNASNLTLGLNKNGNGTLILNVANVSANLVTGLVASNTGLTFTANNSVGSTAGGVLGNALSLVYVNGSGANAATTASVTGNVITVTLGTNATSVVNATPVSVINAIAANASVAALVTASNTTGSHGNGTLAALASTPFANGTGLYYGGATNVNAGTLQQSVANELPTNTTVTLAANTTFDMHGLAANIGALSGSGNVSMSFSGNNGNLTVGNNNAATTFTGVISGNGNLTKYGSGNLTLGGANTFTGATYLGQTATLTTGSGLTGSGNGVQLTANTTATGAAGNAIHVIYQAGSGANVATTATANITNSTVTVILGTNFSGTVNALPTDVVNAIAANATAAGLVTATGSGFGTVAAMSSTALSGGVSDTGTLIISNPLALQDSYLYYINGSGGAISFAPTVTSVTLAELIGNKDLVLSNTNGTALGVAMTDGDGVDETYSGNLSGLGSFTKVGSGNLTFNGNAQYSGLTTVTNGQLILNGTNNTFGGSNIGTNGILTVGNGISNASFPGNVLNNGTLNYNESNITNAPVVTTYAGIISGTGVTNFNGSGVFFQDNFAVGTNVNNVQGDVLVLSGVNSSSSANSGTVNVNNSGLVVNGKVAALVVVNSGAILGGSGNVNGDAEVEGGSLAPGLNATVTYTSTTKGTSGAASGLNNLTIAGNLVWNPDNTVNYWHLSSSNSTVVTGGSVIDPADKITVLGNVTYAGDGVASIVFDFENTGFFDGVHSTTYTLLTTGTGTLTNLGLSLGQFQAENVWHGGQGFGSYFIFANGGTALDFVVIPEPSTYALLAGGAMLILGLRRKRQLAKAAKSDKQTA